MTKYEQNYSNLTINTRKTLCYLSKANAIVLELKVTKIEKLKRTCIDGEV